MARIALAYPKPPKADKEAEQGPKPDNEDANGHAGLPDVESGVDRDNSAR